METTKSISISPAIEFGGGKYDTLNLREPTIGEWQKAETHKTFNQQFVALISTVSEWPEPAVKMLLLSQFNEAVDFLGPFVAGGRATGETSE